MKWAIKNFQDFVRKLFALNISRTKRNWEVKFHPESNVSPCINRINGIPLPVVEWFSLVRFFLLLFCFEATSMQ